MRNHLLKHSVRWIRVFRGELGALLHYIAVKWTDRRGEDMEKIRKLEESKILITLIYSMYIMYTQIHRKKHNNQNNIKLYIDLMS